MLARPIVIFWDVQCAKGPSFFSGEQRVVMVTGTPAQEIFDSNVSKSEDVCAKHTFPKSDDKANKAAQTI